MNARRPFNVVLVCTANVCRSPIGELLLRQAVIDRWGPTSTDAWKITSAGTAARPGDPIHPHARRVLGERGIVAGDFRSRPLDEETMLAADLVLTATRKQRALAVSLASAAVGHTFTLRQFARLSESVADIADDDPAAQGSRLVAAARLARSTAPVTQGSHDDIVDPIGQPIQSFRVCATVIDRAITTLLAPMQRSVPADGQVRDDLEPRHTGRRARGRATT